MVTESSEDRRRTGFSMRAADALEAWLDAHRYLFLGFASALCLVANLGYAHFRSVTADECLQLLIVRQTSLRAIWDSLCAGVQVDPPVQDAVIHYLFGMFGDHLLLARLPSVLGFWLMCLCVSLLVWRHAGAVLGAAAFFAPLATFLRSWASLTRPEALRLAFSALALLCWDRLQQPGLRRVWLWRLTFVVALALMFSTHFFSVTILFPLAVGELLKWKTRGRIDWATVLCIAAGFVPWIVWSPILVAATHTFMARSQPLPALKTLYDFYGDMLFLLPWAGALMLMLLAAAYRGSVADGPALESDAARPAGDVRALLAFCGAAMLLPVLGAIISLVHNGLYWPRMSLIAIIGLIVGLPLLLASSRLRKTAGVALLAAMAANAGSIAAQGALWLDRQQDPYPSFAELRARIREPLPDIVFADDYDFLPIYEVNKNDPEADVIYLFDSDKQYAIRGSDTPDVASRILQNRTRARIYPFDLYVAGHSHFYLLSPVDVVTADSWQFRYLLTKMHARLNWLGNVHGWDLFSVDLPPQSPQQ
jgi:hypothetical protein